MFAQQALLCLSTVFLAGTSHLPSVHFEADVLKGKAPLEVQFTNLTDPDAVAGLDTPTWLWEFGDGETSNSFSPAHTYDSPGNYSVVCTLTSEGRKTKLKRIHYVRVKPIVDETILSWSTYFGGNDMSETWDTAVDGDGNLIVAGGTYADDLPVPDGAYDETHNGDYDIYVAKVRGTDGALLWATYIGDDGYEEVEGMLVLPSGEIIVNGVVDGAFTVPSLTSVGPFFSQR